LQLPYILAERNGVRNLHLSVDVSLYHSKINSNIANENQLSDASKLIPTYRIASGVVAESHYGLALARTVPLPAAVLERATGAAEQLTRINERKKETSKAVVVERKRRLVLDLREQLIQVRHGRMDNEALKQYLRELQKGFILKMTELEQQLAQHSDEIMEDTSQYAGSSMLGEDAKENGDGKENGANPATDRGSMRSESQSWPYGSSDLLPTTH